MSLRSNNWSLYTICQNEPKQERSHLEFPKMRSPWFELSDR
ncbi:hypothetical protein [Nostoc sp. TCL240-02]|nr:hypothetical protein [Nostoc sp. TCL240-02]